MYCPVILAATLLPSEEPGPDSLEVHGHLYHVGACEYFSLFHLGLPFLVSTVGAFSKATSFSFFCYLTEEEELGTNDSHKNGKEQIEEES